VSAEQDKAEFLINVIPEGGKGEAVDFTDEVESFEYEDNEKAADKLSLTLDNYDLSKFDDPRLRKGNFLEVSWGYKGVMTQPRRCVIKSIKGGPNTVTIEAVFKAYDMHQIVKSRVWDNVTRAQVVKKIAEEYGYKTSAQDIEDTSVVQRHVTQARQTDAQFLKSLAGREGFEFYVDLTGLHFHRRKMDQVPSRTLVWFVDKVGTILDFSVESDSKGRKGRVLAKGIDPETKKPFEADAKNDTVKRHSLATLIEVPDEKTGQTTLQTRMATEDVQPSSEQSQAAAKRNADGKFLASQEGSFKLSVSCIGDPLLRAKSVVEILGIGKRLSGKWYVKKAKTKISAGNYTVDLDCVRAEHNGDNGGNNKAAKTKGTLNEKKATGSGALVRRDMVDEKSGEESVTWRVE
jgi:phage protein D